MFDEESESDAAEAAVAGLNNIMDDHSGMFTCQSIL